MAESLNKSNQEKDLEQEIKEVQFEKRKQRYMDMRNLLQEEDLLSYSSYIQGQTVVVTIYTFDIPLKQVKIDLSESDLKIVEKEQDDE